MANLVGEQPDIYNEEELEKLKNEVENIKEDQYLEDVYGVNSKLENEDWLAKHEKAANWMFNTVQIRSRLFKAADIEMRHFNAVVV